MFAIVAASTLARFILIYFNWPVANSDEGNMGLVAFHIAYRGDHPIFFYGLPYLGPLEGYIAAPLFRLFGASLFTLRLGLLPLFAAFLICMYYLARLLYTENFAFAMILLLSFGSGGIILLQVRAVGEYPEIELFSALIPLLAAWLALTSYQGEARQAKQNSTVMLRCAQHPPRTQHCHASLRSASATNEAHQTKQKRILIYTLLGVAIGLALWVDFLILPLVAITGLFLLLFCYRELFSWAGLGLLLGGILGAFPLIFYNLTAPWAQNSWNTLLWIHQDGTQEMVAYLMLWIIATFLAVRVVWQYRHHFFKQKDSLEERQQLIYQCSRLMLLVSVGITLVSYASSPKSAVPPVITFRYLIIAFVAIPTVLWPIWNSLQLQKIPANRKTKISLLLKGGLLLLIAATFVSGTIRTFTEIPTAQAAYQREDILVQDLIHIGATRIYSEYWTCNRLTFHSREQIICSVLDDQLKPGFDRYMPYRFIVRAAPHPTYVVPLGSKQADVLKRQVQASGTYYRQYIFEGYLVIQTNKIVLT